MKGNIVFYSLNVWFDISVIFFILLWYCVVDSFVSLPLCYQEGCDYATVSTVAQHCCLCSRCVMSYILTSFVPLIDSNHHMVPMGCIFSKFWRTSEPSVYGPLQLLWRSFFIGLTRVTSESLQLFINCPVHPAREAYGVGGWMQKAVWQIMTGEWEGREGRKESTSTARVVPSNLGRSCGQHLKNDWVQVSTSPKWSVLCRPGRSTPLDHVTYDTWLSFSILHINWTLSCLLYVGK